MKAKAQKDEGRSKRLLDCMDAMNRHRANAAVLAGLLEYCEPDKINGDLVVEAGVMIGAELEEVRAWTDRLTKELHR
jgi:preprotein translocase subunit Sec61beta